MSAAIRERGLTAEDIDRDPALATEANLVWLLERAVEVYECEGADLGGYDYNLQSYYESCYSVVRCDAAFRALGALARHNRAAWGASARQALDSLRGRDLGALAVSRLHTDTSYIFDANCVPPCEQTRLQLLGEAAGLFAPTSTSGGPAA